MNPVLHKLGFAETERVVILHIDDVGVCEASVSGAADLWQAGMLSSSAVMVPCPWFPSAAALCRANPHMDVGVHLTLTCEWDAMRWGALSTCDRACGLIDSEGYFHRSYSACVEQGDPAAVLVEFEAQVDRALAAGIRPTHIDSHMGTAHHPKFLSAYVATALKYKLPIFIPRQQALNDERFAALARQQIQLLDDAGIATVDHFSWTHLDSSEDKPGELKRALLQLQPGITHFVMHPAKDTPELRALCPDARARAAEYAALCQTDIRQWMAEQGIRIIGYRDLMI